MTVTSASSYFERFSVGQTFEHRRGRTVTQAENVRWTLATLNTAQGHWNVEAMKNYFGGAFSDPIINASVVISFVIGLTSEDVAENIYREVGIKAIKIVTPVFPGDTLWATSEILETEGVADPSHSALLRYKIDARNQHDQAVCSLVRTILVKRESYWGKRDKNFTAKYWPDSL